MAFLLVNNHNADKTFGQTIEMQHMVTNLMVINLTDAIDKELAFCDTNGYVHTFAPCGRYLAFIKIYKSKKKGIMLFF